MSIGWPNSFEMARRAWGFALLGECLFFASSKKSHQKKDDPDRASGAESSDTAKPWWNAQLSITSDRHSLSNQGGA